MACDGVAVLAAQKIRFDVLSELAGATGKKLLAAYLEGKGLKVEGIEVLGDCLSVRVPGGHVVVVQSGGELRAVATGGVVFPGLPGLGRALVDLAGLALGQRVLAAVRKVAAVDGVSVTPKGMVIEARLGVG